MIIIVLHSIMNVAVNTNTSITKSPSVQKSIATVEHVFTKFFFFQICNFSSYLVLILYFYN